MYTWEQSARSHVACTVRGDDERGDKRFGHARNDDADPSELAPGAAENDDDESPSAADPELAAAETAGEISRSPWA